MQLGDLQAQAADDRIIITLPGTNFRAVFLLSPEEPRLVECPAVSTDHESEISNQEFEALAWQAANTKARELGWLERNE
jgi:hypothetical protein